MSKTIRRLKKGVAYCFDSLLYFICSLFPIKNEIVSSSFYGKKYENNSRFIIEKFHENNKEIPIYWVQNSQYEYNLPDYIIPIRKHIQVIYHYATSRVWVDTHNIPMYARKRKKQFYLFSYHAGVGVKKTAADLYGIDRRTDHNSRNISIAISNSDYLNNLLKGPMHYKGEIIKCGLPKNDIFFSGDYKTMHDNVCKSLGLPLDCKLVIYAPSHRQGVIDNAAYNIDVDRTVLSLKERFGGDWFFLVHLHPAEQKELKDIKSIFGNQAVDANGYDNMQELMMASDAFISDYSSSIFEVAPKNIPCLLYASDYYGFIEKRDLYFRLEELPFPIAFDNDELERIIKEYDPRLFEKKWNEFANLNGITDSGNASEKAAQLIEDVIAKYL